MLAVAVARFLGEDVVRQHTGQDRTGQDRNRRDGKGQDAIKILSIGQGQAHLDMICAHTQQHLAPSSTQCGSCD
jgi:hypothetical protein